MYWAKETLPKNRSSNIRRRFGTPIYLAKIVMTCMKFWKKGLKVRGDGVVVGGEEDLVRP